MQKWCLQIEWDDGAYLNQDIDYLDSDNILWWLEKHGTPKSVKIYLTNA